MVYGLTHGTHLGPALTHLARVPTMNIKNATALALSACAAMPCVAAMPAAAKMSPRERKVWEYGWTAGIVLETCLLYVQGDLTLASYERHAQGFHRRENGPDWDAAVGSLRKTSRKYPSLKPCLSVLSQVGGRSIDASRQRNLSDTPFRF